MSMSWLSAVGEVAGGIAILVGLVSLIVFLRPPPGSLKERLIVSFPGAWIIVGLPLTAGIATGLALIAVGLGILR